MSVIESAQQSARQSGQNQGAQNQGGQNQGAQNHGGHVQVGAGAKARILETADRLFYAEGVRAVGIDRLISESAVTKATFYKHYGSKDRLILEYLKTRQASYEAYFADLLSKSTSPADSVRQLVQAIIDDIHRPGFRGCPFINAAAEFSDPRHPVRQIVAVHRDWYTDILCDLLRDVGHPMSGDAGDEMLLARDGAMTGGYAGDPIAASAALQRVVERILADATRS